MLKKRTTETNTLALIREWSMDGAGGDLDGHFASPVDIHAMVSEREADQRGEAAPRTPPPLLLKRAGEDDWRLLDEANAA